MKVTHFRVSTFDQNITRQLDDKEGGGYTGIKFSEW